MKFLITGASGFVGKILCTQLLQRGHELHAAYRTAASEYARMPANAGAMYKGMVIGTIDGKTDWSSALAGMDTVIHLAARVHVMRENAADPLAAFREVNVAGTERLARAAASNGVKRLVYVSSIKVNGEQTAGVPYSELDVPAPQDPYGVSKYEAEQALHRVALETGLEVVIVRPPLVYGPGAGGNFIRLLKLMSWGVPLPLASVRNRRSMIYLGNFVDALIACATHPAAAGKTYLVSDGEDVSTPLLMRNIADLMGKRSRLWPLPLFLLQLAGRMTGMSGEIERLIGSLQIDSAGIRRELDWTPPYSMQQGLAETVRWFEQMGK
jgi:nucleoside-diphosphate-sugar epimerase